MSKQEIPEWLPLFERWIEGVEDRGLLEKLQESLIEEESVPHLQELSESNPPFIALKEWTNSAEGRDRILKAKMISRAASSEKDIEAGRTLSEEEVKERSDAFLRKSRT